MDLILLMLFVILMTQVAILVANLNETSKESSKIRKVFATVAFSCRTMEEVRSELEERFINVSIDIEYDVKVHWNNSTERYDVLILTYHRK